MDSTQEEQEVRPQGRPPGHSGAGERDAAVLKLLEAHEGPGLTRNQVMEQLKAQAASKREAEGYTKSRVYWSLMRLRKLEKVRTCAPLRGQGREMIWSAGTQCP